MTDDVLGEQKSAAAVPFLRPDGRSGSERVLDRSRASEIMELLSTWLVLSCPAKIARKTTLGFRPADPFRARGCSLPSQHSTAAQGSGAWIIFEHLFVTIFFAFLFGIGLHHQLQRRHMGLHMAATLSDVIMIVTESADSKTCKSPAARRNML